MLAEAGGEVESGLREATHTAPSTQSFLLNRVLCAPFQPDKSATPSDSKGIYLPLFDMQERCFAVLWIVGSNVHQQQTEQLLILLGNYVSLAITQQENLKVRNDVIDEVAIISVTDLKGNILEVNDRFCQVSKYTREELIGQNQRIVNSGYHPKSLWKEVWATIGKGKIWRGEVRNRAKDGSIYWVDAVIAPFIGSNGRPYQYFSLRLDITSKKDAEQQLMLQQHEMAASEEEMRQQAEEVNAINNNLEDILRSEINQKQALAVRDTAMNEAAIVSITDLKGNILEINDRFCQVSQYSRAALLGKNQSIVSSHTHPKEFWKNMWATIGKGKMWRGEICNRAKDGSIYWVDTTIVAFKNEEGRPYRYFSLRVEVTQQKENEQVILSQQEQLQVSNEELNAINDKLSVLNNDLKVSKAKITSSINYARRIQSTLLPSKEELVEALGPNHFVSLYPRDIVSGDFYWVATASDGSSILVLSDCTGHGVPGAFMSALGISLLARAVYTEHKTSPAAILDSVKGWIEEMLRQEGGINRRSNSSMEGMDTAVITINPEKTELRFAGAKQPLYILRPNQDIEVIKGTNLSVGGNILQRISQFKEHVIPIEKGMQVFLSSDGYLDQFDFTNRRKFSRKRFVKLLQSIRSYSVPQQADEIDQTLQRWKGTSPQIDDISVVGLHFVD